MPSELALNSHFEFVGGVHIEAGFDNDLSQHEIRWLEQDVYPITPKFNFKSIAYVDVKKPNVTFSEQLKKIAIYTTFVGIRYIIDENELLMSEIENVSKNLKFLEKAGLLLEIQVRISDELHTSLLLSILSDVPQLTIIINHAGFPPIANTSVSNANPRNNSSNNYEMANWKKNLARFAQLPNCFIKCSGFEMQNRNYTPQDVFQVISFVHELFGNDRLMLASNFPLTLFSASYTAYWQLLYDCAKEAKIDCERVMYLNARILYSRKLRGYNNYA